MPLEETRLDAVCSILLSTYDPDEIIDLLGMDADSLVEELRNYIADNLHEVEARL